MSRTFRQADYGVVKGISMAGSGCGPSAVASIAVNLDASVTPADAAAWFIQKRLFFISRNDTDRYYEGPGSLWISESLFYSGASRRERLANRNGTDQGIEKGRYLGHQPGSRSGKRR